MSELIYIDTNVWIDYFLNRSDRLRPLGDFAHELLKKTISCKYKVAISDWLKKEINSTGHTQPFSEIEKELQRWNKIIFIKTSFDDINNAKKTKHWHDSLHEILAIKSNAKYLVTRNQKDFSGEKIAIVLPESLWSLSQIL